jgi:hypothetical protein
LNAQEEASFKADLKASDDAVFSGAEVMVNKRLEGDHIFKDTPAEQRADVDREVRECNTQSLATYIRVYRFVRGLLLCIF